MCILFIGNPATCSVTDMEIGIVCWEWLKHTVHDGGEGVKQVVQLL